MVALTSKVDRVSEKAFNSLVLICSAAPEGTRFQNLRAQLTNILRGDMTSVVSENFYFDQYRNSPTVHNGITFLVTVGYLVPFGDKDHLTNGTLYWQANRVRGDFSEEEREYLEEIGKRLEGRRV